VNDHNQCYFEASRGHLKESIIKEAKKFNPDSNNYFWGLPSQAEILNVIANTASKDQFLHPVPIACVLSTYDLES
jgi:hypothetical protein